MTLKACVIGDPVAHSKSPIIHEYWIKKQSIEAEFQAIKVASQDLESFCKKAVYEGVKGFSVTLPHKEKIVPFCTTLDEAALATGAVNCVVIKDNYMHGMNTDAYGFLANISPLSKSIKKALVLGAGGATRAVIYGLLQKNISVFVSNRTNERALKIAADFDVKAIPWEDRHQALEGIDMLVNTTSLGMKGAEILDLDLSALSRKAVVTDIVYTPLMTDLLQRAQQRGNIVITGIGMLAHQAVPAFEAWFGIRPVVDEDLLGKLKT